MTKLKYAVGSIPLINEHKGFTFQSSRIGQTAMSSQKNDRARQLRQINKKYNLMQAVTNYRNLTAAEKLAWSVFASTYPQPCKNPDSGFLSGYQLFIKRQQYIFLNEGITSDFLTAPLSEVLILNPFTVSIDQTENCLDVTEPYIKNFGLIPKPGQFLLLKVLPYAIDSGQFFPIITQTIETLESYIDGLFVSLHLPADIKNTVFSVYLSKPVWRSKTYSGTKTRYMGCFTTKTFLGLTDTPDSYVGQANKTVSVKPDESGLEFSVPSAGGLTCATLPACAKIIAMDSTDASLQAQITALPTPGISCADLPACPTIISMNSTDNYIISALLANLNTSVPPVKFGILYNSYAMLSPLLLKPSWSVLSKVDAQNWLNSIGNLTVAGQALIENSLLFWLAVNVGVTNSLLLNLRGNGYRSSTGNFVELKTSCNIWTTTPSGAHNWWLLKALSASPSCQTLEYAGAWLGGYGIRPFKVATGITNGTKGSYTGNDGKVYRTIVINNYEILADNLAETKFTTGVDIPYVPITANWTTLISPGYCYYNNLFSNV